MAEYLDKNGLDTLIENIKSKDDDLSNMIDDVAQSSLTGVSVNGTLANVTDRVADITMGGDVFCGTCNTRPSSISKEVSCPDLTELKDGVLLFVSFVYESTVDAPTLNVNGLGDVGLVVDGRSVRADYSYRWAEDVGILFAYRNGSWWVVSGKNTYFSYSDAKPETVEKTLGETLPYILQLGTQIMIQFGAVNTADSPTLNVCSTGAFPIVGNTDWAINDYVTFVFDGANYVIQDSVSSNGVYYGYCDTSSDTYEKDIECPEFTNLVAGATVLVDFKQASSVSAPLLNINNTGAKPVCVYSDNEGGSDDRFFKWAACTFITFIYSGEYWVPINEPTVPYIYCSTASGIPGKSADAEGFVVREGTRATICFRRANTAEYSSTTLNLGGTGAYPILGNASWSADSYVTFVYTNGYYVIQEDAIAQEMASKAFGSIYYANCSTAYQYAEKVVEIDEVTELYTGLAVSVYFENGFYDDSPTLKINSLSARPIYVNGAVADESNYFLWTSGTTILFVYDGLYWQPISYKETYYSTCDTDASELIKKISINGAVITQGTEITVCFTNGNTNSGIRLGLPGGNFTVAGSSNWNAGDSITFVYRAQTEFVIVGCTNTDNLDESILNNAKAYSDGLYNELLARIKNLEEEVDSLVPHYFAVYSESYDSLTFYEDTTLPNIGDTYYGKKVTNLYTDIESTGTDNPPWYDVREHIYSVEITESFSSAKPTSCYAWFSGFTKCDTFTGLEFLNTSEVTNMAYMFYDCSSVAELDVGNFDTAKVTNMSHMFEYCEKLTKLNARNLSGRSVTSIENMFMYCTSLEVVDMYYFDFFIRGSTAERAFAYCENLRTIYGYGWDDEIVYGGEVFINCYNIVGEGGVTYDGNKIDISMANSSGGYFSKLPS